MVHQKNASTSFDFATQGIEMYVDGDWVRAKGTTLGADNGLGVASLKAACQTYYEKYSHINCFNESKIIRTNDIT